MNGDAPVKTKNVTMVKAYWKYLTRNLVANKTDSFLNITGLSAGLTCFAFIFLWVANEISYDRFNKNYERIVRLVSTTKTETGTIESAPPLLIL
jgi:putative ABC transport system permease protein